MDDSRLRAWRFQRQGLDGSLAGRPPASVLQQSGWARSVGGVGPYLTLHARAGTSRQQADAAAANLEIHELPAARGCTYVVPAADFAIALRCGQGFSDESTMRTARKLGVTDAEIETLSAKIVSALGKAVLDPEEIREAVGGAVRNLGEEGKKKGMITTLPVALGFLQSSGEIRRVPVNGRLDQQRYRYARWDPSPLSTCKLSRDEALAEMARRFFRWIGPASIAEFQWFSGLSAKAAKAVTADLGLVPFEEGSDRLMFPSDRDALDSFTMPKEPQYAMVSSLDAFFLLRREIRSLIVAADAERSVFIEKDQQPMGSLADLPSHALLDRGRLIGLWEFDPQDGSIALDCFIKKDKALTNAVNAMERYVKDELGDARSFSLDSPKSRAPRIAALRKGSAS